MGARFTVYFEHPFWVGVLELDDADGVRAARHVFGSEPTGPELMEFVRRDFLALRERALACPPVPADELRRADRSRAHKAARAGAKDARRFGDRPSTAAFEAMRERLEARKKERTASARERRANEQEHRRAVREAKRKARRRGR
ncbi:YjdF family protein [Nocardiopsis sp. RSe5-2]|uniref:YjdF family protein n=1 Tax=Nocardiopsis endophytica TaxID=3018445 RepID=A0ABT4TZ89_9ACTN|nr:YjdF family protein [Nocardiopsis endophytica]MDA2809554.1 YjdF family protein [Nocardiopsis endophytica]